MIDHPIISPEPAYAVLAFIAWCWAAGQIYWLIKRPTAWRVSTALWMVSKACFFTFIGSVFWFDWFNETAHSLVIWSFALVHLAVFIHWLLLPPSGRDHLAPLKDG